MQQWTETEGNFCTWHFYLHAEKRIISNHQSWRAGKCNFYSSFDFRFLPLADRNSYACTYAWCVVCCLSFWDPVSCRRLFQPLFANRMHRICFKRDPRFCFFFLLAGRILLRVPFYFHGQATYGLLKDVFFFGAQKRRPRFGPFPQKVYSNLQSAKQNRTKAASMSASETVASVGLPVSPRTMGSGSLPNFRLHSWLQFHNRYTFWAALTAFGNVVRSTVPSLIRRIILIILFKGRK